MEERRLLASVLIHETVGRTLINDNRYGTDYYDISLSDKPTSEVTFHLSSSDPTVYLFSQENLIARVNFTPDDWTPKRVVVYGLLNDSITGNFQAILSQTIETQDPQYVGVVAPDVLVTVVDTNSQPFVIDYDVELTEGQSQVFFISANYPPDYSGPAFVSTFDAAQLTYEPLNGSNTFTLGAVNDGVIEGVHDVPIVYTPTEPNPNNIAIPNVIVRITDSPTPVLSTFQINAGATQRSVVTSLALNFSAPIFVNPGLITLTNTTTNTSVPLLITVDAVGLTMNIAFASGSSVMNRVGGNTLADGKYVLNVPQNAITHRQSGAPLAHDIVIGDTANEQLFRLFGDLNGSGAIETAEILAFARALLRTSNSHSYVAAFDERGEGFIGLDDLLRFTRNIGRRFR